MVSSFTTGVTTCQPGPPIVISVGPPDGTNGICPNTVAVASFSTAIPVHVNFAINNMDRVGRELRAALVRHQKAVLLTRQEAQHALRNALKGTITALLLSCELALQVPDLQSGAESRMRTVHELAKEIRLKLEGPV
jgi:translation elongation factor EF-G